MTVIAIISARMGSSRLPGKVLMEIGDRPLLSLQIERVLRATTIEKIVVATSHEPQDDPIAVFCDSEGVLCFRGSEADVLDRIYKAAIHFGADPVVRLTGDDPMADPVIIDKVVGTFIESEYDYVSNVNPPTYPDGLDVEVVGVSALEKVWKEATTPEEREHVTLGIRQNLDQYKTYNVVNSEDLSSMHWAVDTVENFSFVQRVFEMLHSTKPDFNMHDVLAIMKEGEMP